MLIAPFSAPELELLAFLKLLQVKLILQGQEAQLFSILLAELLYAQVLQAFQEIAAGLLSLLACLLAGFFSVVEILTFPQAVRVAL